MYNMEYSAIEVLMGITKPMLEMEDISKTELSKFADKHKILPHYGYEYRGVQLRPTKPGRSVVFTVLPEVLHADADKVINQAYACANDLLRVKEYIRDNHNDLPESVLNIAGVSVNQSEAHYETEEGTDIVDLHNSYKMMLLLAKG